MGRKLLLFLFIFFISTASPAYAKSFSVTGKAKAMSSSGSYLDFTNYSSNVTVNTATAVLSGYAFSEDAGWVAFGTTDNVQGPVAFSMTTGRLSGKAKILNSGAFIDFGNYNSNVTLNTSTGTFSGYAFSEDLGWFNFTDTGVSAGPNFTINVWTTAPSPSGPASYITDTKPMLVFKKATSESSISSYSVYLDSGKNRNFSASGIPASGNGSPTYVWNDDSSVKVEFLNENDSDSGNDEVRVYFKDLDKQDLSEGKHTWTATVYDSVSNSTSKSADFYIDKTAPSISNLAIANLFSVAGGSSYKLDVTNRTPSFSGLAHDPYQGSVDVGNANGTKDTFDKVSSGPQTLTLTFKRQKDANTYSDYLTKDFSLSDIQDAADDKKYTRFYITTPSPLVDGYYQITILLKDSAGNSYTYPNFYLALNASKISSVQNLLTGNLETNITSQETVPAVTPKEKQQIQENGYTVKVKVLDTKNKPVAGAKVTIHSKVQETTTDKNGIASFSNVEHGDHKILIAYSGYTGEQAVNLTGDVKEFDFNIQVKPQSAFLNPLVIGVIAMLIIALITVSGFLILRMRKPT